MTTLSLWLLRIPYLACYYILFKKVFNTLTSLHWTLHVFCYVVTSTVFGTCSSQPSTCVTFLCVLQGHSITWCSFFILVANSRVLCFLFDVLSITNAHYVFLSFLKRLQNRLSDRTHVAGIWLNRFKHDFTKQVQTCFVTVRTWPDFIIKSIRFCIRRNLAIQVPTAFHRSNRV